MLHKPLVSVVIPCYNHEKFVEHAIESVINQTYKNIELIVIDDGSKDLSPKIVEKLAKEYGFLFVRQENSGVCKTLNRAVNLAKGELIGVLASDDYWHEEKIEKQLLCLINSPGSELCYCQALEFSEDEGIFKKLRIFPKRPWQGYLLPRVFFSQHVPAGSILFSKKLFDTLGGFDENFLEEDWDFLIRCAAETKICAVGEPLFYYRSHSTNVMKTRPRPAIFRQKALLLSKNMNLAGCWIWLFAILIHFFHDIIFCSLVLSCKKFWRTN